MKARIVAEKLIGSIDSDQAVHGHALNYYNEYLIQHNYSKTSEQQLVGTDRLTFVERIASLWGFLEYYANNTLRIIHNIIEIDQ